MTKTPVLSQLPWRQQQSARGKALSEPFLLATGKTATSGPIERSKLPTRWLVLFLASLLLTCNYYCYDNPSALYAPLARQFESLHGFDYWFDMLYSIYSIPNVVLPLLGGILVDHAGLYRSLNLFAILILIGQILFAAGCSMTNMWVMVAGRFVFGLGGEAITVAQTALVERWFCNSGELALAMGISLSISRLGSVVNNVASPYIASVTLSPAMAIWVGVILSVITLFCCLWLECLDRRSAWIRVAKDALRAAWVSSMGFTRPFWLLALCCVVIYGTVLPFNNIASALLLERDFFPQGSVWPQPSGRDFLYDGRHPHPPGVNCGTPRGAQTPFCTALALAIAKADWVMSEPYLMSACLTPLFGSLVDKCGYRADLVLLSAVCLLVTHLLLSFTAISAEILLIGMGVGYSVFASVIWPAIPSVVEQRLLGTAYGMITVLQNMGLSVLPLIIGVVLDVSREGAPPVDPNPYQGVTLFFAALALSGVACSLLLNSDRFVYHALNRRGGMLPSATPSPTASP